MDIALLRGKRMKQWFKFFIVAQFAFFSSSLFAQDLTNLLKQGARTNQLIVVIAENNQTNEATLQRYARINNRSKWQKVGESFTVNLGKKGLAWDQNLPETIRQHDPIKQEGDYHSPAGIFAVGDVFATDTIKTNMPFFKLQQDTICVDDANSKYYNKILINSNAVKKDWNSAEQMHDYPEYDRGIVVQYNSAQTKHAGSCIFMHIKYSPTTSGCTSMSKENIETLIAWLNVKQHPVLVQVSQIDLEKLKPLLRNSFKFSL